MGCCRPAGSRTSGPTQKRLRRPATATRCHDRSTDRLHTLGCTPSRCCSPSAPREPGAVSATPHQRVPCAPPALRRTRCGNGRQRHEVFLGGGGHEPACACEEFSRAAADGGDAAAHGEPHVRANAGRRAAGPRHSDTKNAKSGATCHAGAHGASSAEPLPGTPDCQEPSRAPGPSVPLGRRPMPRRACRAPPEIMPSTGTSNERLSFHVGGG